MSSVIEGYPDLPPDAVIVAEVRLLRFFTTSMGSETDITVMEDQDGEGNQLPLVEILGLLRLAEETAISTRMSAKERGD